MFRPGLNLSAWRGLKLKLAPRLQTQVINMMMSDVCCDQDLTLSFLPHICAFIQLNNKKKIINQKNSSQGLLSRPRYFVLPQISKLKVRLSGNPFHSRTTNLLEKMLDLMAVLKLQRDSASFKPLVLSGVAGKSWAPP